MKYNPYRPTDEEALRQAVQQVLMCNLSCFREGTGWYDPNAGASFVKQGLLTADGAGTTTNPRRLRLSEAAVVRVLKVAVEAAVNDLLANDPPPEKIPWRKEEYESNDRLLLLSDHRMKPYLAVR